MHYVDDGAPKASLETSGPWWRELNRYHWFVFVVCALGWLFDTMDQQLFTLVRAKAIEDLLPPEQLSSLSWYSGLATSIFLIGWASGGIVFGIMGDRLGRAKTMLVTILIYSIFTGLSALSQNFWQFGLFRFLTGLGVGGEFAVGIALLAEVMPDRARTSAIGWLQSLSAVGNITAAILTMLISDWRTLFWIGTGPALLAILIRRKLKEPEKWQKQAHHDGVSKKMGSVRELFTNATWRHHAIIGFLLAFAGVVGLWGIGFFAPDLLRLVFKPVLEAQGFEGKALQDRISFWIGINSVLQNGGGFLGIQAFLWLTIRTNRRIAFTASFIIALVSTAFFYNYFGKIAGFYDVYWMTPLMGFCQLSLFGGYAIYLPELFPTRLRSTGTSFCYNVGRFVAAIGPFTLGYLTSTVFKDYTDPMRWAGMAMCSVFLIGLLTLPFAPETKGKPLPE